VRDPERILIVRLSHLGDVVHALGVFHALHEAFPRATLAWAIQPEFADLLQGLPGLERVLFFERAGGAPAWLRLRRELADFRPDLTVDAQGNTKSAAVAWLSGAARRAAPARSDWREPWAAWVANERAQPLRAPARHAMQRMEALVRRLVPSAGLPLRVDVALSAAERERGEQALLERLPRACSKPALVHLSSPEDVRGWPRAHWRTLLEELRANGRGALVLSGPAEADLGRELERDVPAEGALTHWIDQRGLRLLAGVFEAAARRDLALIACDSGPMHLAAASGLRVVALGGPQDAARTGPWPLEGSGPHRVVRAARPPPCAPCLSRRCHHREGPVCMLGIAPEDVLARLG